MITSVKAGQRNK